MGRDRASLVTGQFGFFWKPRGVWRRGLAGRADDGSPSALGAHGKVAVCSRDCHFHGYCSWLRSLLP